MEQTDINKIRSLPIEGVASRLGLSVEKHKSLCPFHSDSHPSLTFNVSKNTFRCYVCGAHGGVLDLVMNHLHKTFVEACKWLADENNIILQEYKPAEKTTASKRKFDASKYLSFFEHPYLNEASTDFLYKERHIDPRVVKWCKLNSFTDRKGISWLQIPYYDVDGNLMGVQSRNLCFKRTVGEPVEPRFKFPYGSTCHIYNLPVLKMLKPNEPLFITEGASDCWAMLSSGHKAIAIPSATLLNKKDLLTLSSSLSLNWHIYPDADIPGEKLYFQLVSVANDLGACIVRHSLPHGFKDFGAFWASKNSK